MNNIITGYKFAEMSDLVFCGIFLKNQIDTLDLNENIEDYVAKNEYIFVRKKTFTLKENDIIFCKTEFVYELFRILKNFKEFKNIKLITHQSDKSVTKKMYSQKPSCISKWYAANVDYEAENLIPIPLGVANFHSKNLSQNDFNQNIENQDFINSKVSQLYLNFNPNTNFTERMGLFKQFEKFDWATIDKTPIDNKSYMKKLKSHTFILSPSGNGIDTHRFWEALYSGSIPITRNQYMYKKFDTFPMVLVEDYKFLSQNLLESVFAKIKLDYKNYNLRQLDFQYWKDKIIDNTHHINNNEEVFFNNNRYAYYGYRVELRHYLDSKLKIFNRLRRFLYRKFGI